MSTNHNRIKVADLETNEQNKILKTNAKGELEFSDFNNIKIETYNALNCIEEGKALDARQGKVLKEMIDNIPPQAIQDVSATQPGIVNNTSLQELGGGDKTINGVRIGRGNGNEVTNTIVGHDALINNTNEGYNNTAIGYSSLQSNTDGCENTAIGDRAGLNNTSGAANTFIGEITGYRNTIGNDNTAIGAGALKENISGHGNTVIGSLAGDDLVTGSYNTIIGRPSGLKSNDSCLVVLADGGGTVAIRKESDNRLLAPSLTNALIDLGGDKSLITKEYLLPELSAKVSGTIATDNETQIDFAVPEDKKVVSRLKLFNWWNWIKSQTQTIKAVWNFNLGIKVNNSTGNYVYTTQMLQDMFIAQLASAGYGTYKVQYGWNDIKMYNSNNFYTQLGFLSSTQNNNVNLPNKSGTVALINDFVTTAAGIATTAPLVIPNGVLTTVPQNGAIERDQNGQLWETHGGVRSKIISGSKSQNYKVCTLIINQTGTNPPEAVVLENTLSSSITFEYSSRGNYKATLTNAFPDGKTFFVATTANIGVNIDNMCVGRIDDNTINLNCYRNSYTFDGIKNAMLEIRVYE